MVDCWDACSRRSAAAIEGVHRVHAEPAQRLGFPAAYAVVDPGQPGQLGGLAEGEVGEGSGRQIGRGQPAAHVAAGMAEAGDAGRARHSRTSPEARRAPRTRRGRWCPGGGRKHLVQQRGERVDGLPLGDPGRVGAGAVAVRNAAPAEGDPTVRGALRVHVGVRGVAQHLAPGPADLIPGGVGERFGDDHRGVHRQPVAALAADARREALEAAQDLSGADGAAVGDRTPGRDLAYPGLLVDRHAEPLDRRRQAADQLRGLDPGGVRGVGRTERARHADPLAELVRGQPGDAVAVRLF